MTRFRAAAGMVVRVRRLAFLMMVVVLPAQFGFAQKPTLGIDWVIRDPNWKPSRGYGRSAAGTGVNRAEAVANQHRIRIQRRLDPLGAVTVRLENSPQGWETLRTFADQGLEVRPTVRIEPTETIPADPFFSQQWHLQNLGQSGGMAGFDTRATLAWPVTTGSASTILAITDSGVQPDHIDMVGRMWINTGEVQSNGLDDDGNGYVDDVSGWNSALNAPGPLADPALAGHGTAVAGTASATGSNGIGVAGLDWNCRIMPVVIFDPNYVGTDVSAAEGILYAVRAGAHIINASWGTREYSPIIQAAVEFAAAENVLVVAAAGNDGVSSDLHPFFPAATRQDNLISVGGANRFGGWAHNFGRRTVTLAAPSESIFQPRFGNIFSTGSGTSYGAPQVSGVLGLMRSAGAPGSGRQHRYQLEAMIRSFPGLLERNGGSGLLAADGIVAQSNDAMAPSRIQDLELEQSSVNGVVLRWTAVGDDGGIGLPAGYSIRISDHELTDEEFKVKPAVPIQIVPKAPGERMWAVVAGLQSDRNYVAQVRAHDENGNFSPVSEGLEFRTDAWAQVYSFDPCDSVGTTWTASGGMTLAPGSPLSGILSWQDSPGENYLPGTTATLILSAPIDLSGAQWPAVVFGQARQLPNHERLDALVVEAWRVDETTATTLAVLGGSFSPMDLAVAPIPPDLIHGSPVIVRFRIQSDMGSLVSGGVELDDLAIVDLAHNRLLTPGGETVMDPKSWLGQRSPRVHPVGVWSDYPDSNLAPGTEGLGTYQLDQLSTSTSAIQMDGYVGIPGNYKVEVSWPSGVVAQGVELIVHPGALETRTEYNQTLAEGNRWVDPRNGEPIAIAGPQMTRFQIEAKLGQTFGTVLAPSIRLRWLSPLNSSTRANHYWLVVPEE